VAAETAKAAAEAATTTTTTLIALGGTCLEMERKARVVHVVLL